MVTSLQRRKEGRGKGREGGSNKEVRGRNKINLKLWSKSIASSLTPLRGKLRGDVTFMNYFISYFINQVATPTLHCNRKIPKSQWLTATNV